MNLAEQRMINNQVVFRRFNERMLKGFQRLNEIAAEEGEAPLYLEGDEPIYYICECSDENCTKRVKLTPDTYKKIHKNRKRFTVLHEHSVIGIEKITDETQAFVVVEKIHNPNQEAKLLATTSVDNS